MSNDLAPLVRGIRAIIIQLQAIERALTTPSDLPAAPPRIFRLTDKKWVQRPVLLAIREGAATTDEIAKGTGLKATQIHNAVHLLTKSGTVRKIRAGVYRA